MNDVLKQINALGIVPVVKIDRVEDAVPLAKALCEGGLPVAEVTFRTACAKEAIKKMATEFPDMLIGAGTVLTTEQVDQAVEAGAKFIVSPGLNPKVVKYCVDKGILITPGCANPSDVEQAIELGLDTVKIFPAEAVGGLNLIKSMAGPYTTMKFMPTGGINAKNLNSYLAFDKIIACGGSWMVDPKLVAEGDFAKITELTREAVTQMLGFELAHVGINMPEAGAATEVAKGLGELFNLEVKDGNSSLFAGTGIEVMKTPYLGEKGHIAYKTNYIDRAVNYLKARGYEFDEDSAKYDAKGKLVAIYLKQEFGGFAIHLLQKK
ncbi:2-dehydro-3-deoxyphosphogluconate aldolase [Sporanaerobium hydrogeniformans]|uniref:2-dehydro-3-deoxyphosphogluconate aldolase n=1 Tax=Sporanaerobium hydrogeniformans TaxID=3072179 RepID=A0AC61DBD8_9FIRM|nr:bifunctional 4-hydroxy-2-oxoglutarate aldolase/2-dehydro-3-deoxy-phosphogluconate aldolase [Sporanaerobium hydrogeniformans]PHV70220.1 2-dehydro-3-deoxyphosphogluconate aldolase [Sporanaerobium hydrogeniformans]